MAATTRSLNRTPQELARRHHLHDAASGALGDSVRVVAPRPAARLTCAQRNGRACVACGRTTGLQDAGHVEDEGLVYAVVVCSACPRYAASLEAHR
ncbi:hypothetical protein ACGF07_25395 [Kitasatospora sp. NPDC048194]|uniref:hypothetical protein n=1 Tax=Kitasatospora sp. NPDC048194 TaxID=3364045 RepID=UPI0037226E5C